MSWRVYQVVLRPCCLLLARCCRFWSLWRVPFWGLSNASLTHSYRMSHDRDYLPR